MPMATGDIIIFSSGCGHAAMAYDAKRAIHGNAAKNFHLVDLVQEKDNKINHFTQAGQVFRPPWDKIGGETENYKNLLRQNADIIRLSAQYGLYRAVRLLIGNSAYGPGAAERLMKYRERIRSNKTKVIEKITCSEAVILCFQLTFLEHGGPGFIKLDAAHSMPSTLAKWCTDNWGASTAG